MLKTVSSIANAIGALNYKGTWDANANSPALASSVGTKGDYYVVGTAGTTSLNGISNWGIGDWAVFNGSVWQRVEGGADLNGVNLSVTGTSQLTGDATFSDNLTQGTAAKGVNFTANTPAAGMTSQLLNWYEEGTFTPTLAFGGGSTGITYTTQTGTYTRSGRTVTIRFEVELSNKGSSTGAATITGLPYSAAALTPVLIYLYSNFSATYKTGVAYIGTNTVYEIASFGTASFTDANFTNTSRLWASATFQV